MTSFAQSIQIDEKQAAGANLLLINSLGLIVNKLDIIYEHSPTLKSHAEKELLEAFVLWLAKKNGTMNLTRSFYETKSLLILLLAKGAEITMTWTLFLSIFFYFEPMCLMAFSAQKDTSVTFANRDIRL